MSGLRERKRHRTATAIHVAAMRLFAERGYDAVTVADIAEAAEVGRATVFSYYGSKEAIVWGEGRQAAEALHAALTTAGPDERVVDVVAAWLRPLVGWLEPGVVLQRRLAEEVPAVGAERARVVREMEAVIADALEHELRDADPLAPRLVAGVLTSAMEAVEAEAARRFAGGGDPLDEAGVDALLRTALVFVDGGLSRLPAR